MLGVSPESNRMLVRQAKFKLKQTKQARPVNSGPHYNHAQWDMINGSEYRK